MASNKQRYRTVAALGAAIAVIGAFLFVLVFLGQAALLPVAMATVLMAVVTVIGALVLRLRADSPSEPAP